MKELSKEDKERIEIICGKAWELATRQLKDGVNPHAYRLGFLEGFRQSKTEGFNEGIEAALQVLLKYNIDMLSNIEEIKGLKK